MACGKYHLVEVGEAEVTIFVVAIKVDQICHILLLDLVLEVVL
jgi:hypothetical protein